MSDRDLLKDRSVEEIRYLKKHVEAIRADESVIAATEAYENARPRFTLEAFQNGVLIDGRPCRLTIGTLAMLKAIESRCLGYGESEEPLDDFDVAAAVFVLCDETRNAAVSSLDDFDELAESITKFARRLDLKRAAVDLYEYLRRTGSALASEEQQGAESDSPAVKTVDLWNTPDDAWADDLDLLCHEYPAMRDDYVLWELPLVRVVRLKESMRARHANRPRHGGSDKLTIELLEAIEKRGRELKDDGK